MSATDWVTLDDLKNDQTLDGQLSTRDDKALQRTLDAAMSWVMTHRPDIDYHGSWTVPAEVRLGTIRLAARWFIRRVTPDALLNLGQLGGASVITVDPDIFILLGIVGGLA